MRSVCTPGATEQPTDSNIGVSRGSWPWLHGPSGHYMGPMGARAPILSPNDHPNPSQGRQKRFGKGRILKIF